MKECTVCHDLLPDTGEYFDSTGMGNGKLKSQCRICRAIIRKIEHLKDPSKSRERSREYYHKDLEKSRAAKLRISRTLYSTVSARKYAIKEKYGLSISELQEMMNLQRGCCKICNCSLIGDESRNYAIDHCHLTGVVRGLLCNSCNCALGLMKDSEDLLQKAIDYLRGSDGKSTD